MAALVALGVVAAVARVVAIAGVAAPLTASRLAAARALLPAYATDILEMEQHFSNTGGVTVVHVTTGAVFLVLGLLQFSASMRRRHLRFHRRSGYCLVTLALAAGTTGLWMGIVAPYSSNERLPIAAAGGMFLLAPLMAIVAIRRGETNRHREWMIRFFAVGVGIVVVRLIDPLLIWLLRPERLADIIGLTFWAGWLVSITVAEARIRWTRSAYRLNVSAAATQA